MRLSTSKVVVVLTSVGQLLAPLAKMVVEIVATPTSMPTPRTNMAEHEVAADLFPFFGAAKSRFASHIPVRVHPQPQHIHT